MIFINMQVYAKFINFLFIFYQVWANLITNSSLTALLNASCPYIGLWLAMTMQSEKIPYDVSNVIQFDAIDSNKVFILIIYPIFLF